MSSSKEEFMRKVQQALDSLGVNISNLQLDLSGEKGKELGLDGDNFFDNIDEEEQERLLKTVVDTVKEDVRQRKSILRNSQKQGIQFDALEAFEKERTEKNLLAVKKQTIEAWKSEFMVMQYKKTHGEQIDLPYSDEDLQAILEALELSFAVDRCLIHENAEIDKILDCNLTTRSQQFLRDLQEYEQDVEDYEKQFKLLQITCQTLAEFEEQMKIYEQAYTEKNNGKTLADKDRLLFREKKELEGMYRELGASMKKLITHAKEAKKANDKLKARKEQDKKTNMHLYYGAIHTLLDSSGIDDDVELLEGDKIVFDDNERTFKKACDRQLKAKQHLKDVTASITSYKEVVRESEKKEKAKSGGNPNR